MCTFKCFYTDPKFFAKFSLNTLIGYILIKREVFILVYISIHLPPSYFYGCYVLTWTREKMCARRIAIKAIKGCMALVPPWDFGKILVPSPFFPPTQTWKSGSLPFVSEISEKFLRANLSNFVLIYRNHCKKTPYYHLSMTCTINVNKGCNICCHRQKFEEIYANFPLKLLIFVLFYPWI